MLLKSPSHVLSSRVSGNVCVLEGMCYEPSSVKTILVVEDDLARASRLSELLARQATYEIILVSDCLTTLKFLHYCTPDLIILDERLLHSNGIELGPRLAVMKELQDIPILVLSVDGVS